MGQKDEDGDVATDTLILRRPASAAQVRVTLLAGDGGALPFLKFVGACFSRQLQRATNLPPLETAPARVVLPVPERAQLAYVGGRDWCSPTCVSMVLSYWAEVLQRPELDVAVPEVAAAVYDRNWPGTGNWPFNTAFAGQFPGLRGFVTRLETISDLEQLVTAGVPPILSVAFDLLNGGAVDRGGGHLVVCIGFDDHDNLVLRDPWAAGAATGAVRRIVPRKVLAKAWARSRNTVYLIFPEDRPLPRGAQSHW